jgi:hypothetical protein
MRKDALITFIMLETFCIASLLYYLMTKIFSWDTKMTQHNAIAGLYVAGFALVGYRMFALAIKLLDR